MEQKIKSKNTNAFDNNHLTFKPKNLNAKYGCSVLFDNGKSQNEIRYKLNITFNGNLENRVKTYTVDREDNIYINDIKPENFIDKLAFETSNVLYPLKIKTKNNGKLLEILNFTEILKRWEITKKKLTQNYKSKLTLKYINATDKSLISKEVLLKKINKDWFINLYFNKLYKFYSQDLYINEKLRYPILGDVKPVEYQVISKIQLNEDTKDIKLDINGIINDERCAIDLEQKLDNAHYKALNKDEKPMLGSCNLIYLFEGNTGIIEAIEAEFDTQFSTPKKILVKMYLLKKLDSKNAFVVEDENADKKEKKTSLWSKIFNI